MSNRRPTMVHHGDWLKCKGFAAGAYDKDEHTTSQIFAPAARFSRIPGLVGPAASWLSCWLPLSFFGVGPRASREIPGHRFEENGASAPGDLRRSGQYG